MMRWSEAFREVDEKALSLGMLDEDGEPLDAEAVLAIAIPFSGWDDFERELKQRTACPETFRLWALAHLEVYRRKRVRRKTMRLLAALSGGSD